MGKKENTGTSVTVFLDSLEGIESSRQLQALFETLVDFPEGDASDFLRNRCLEKANQMGWAPPTESEFGY